MKVARYLKYYIFFVPAIISIKINYAQFTYSDNDDRRIEAGINTGATFFLGDLGGNKGFGKPFIKDLNFNATKFIGGLYVSASPNSWLGLTIAGNLTSVAGNDKLITDKGTEELARKDRNLDFKSKISELYAVVEFYPVMYFKRNDGYKPKLRPYLLGGIGMFKFNPQGSLTAANGNITWYNLQPLHTEGEGFAEYPNRPNYKLTQLNIPLGGGLKYFISETLNLNLEFLYRKTFTDYIDDVSTNYIDKQYFYKNLSKSNADLANELFDKTIAGGVTPDNIGAPRGDSKDKDAYFSLAIKLGIKLWGNFSDNSVNSLDKIRF